MGGRDDMPDAEPFQPASARYLPASRILHANNHVTGNCPISCAEKQAKVPEASYRHVCDSPVTSVRWAKLNVRVSRCHRPTGQRATRQSQVNMYAS